MLASRVLCSSLLGSSSRQAISRVVCMQLPARCRLSTAPSRLLRDGAPGVTGARRACAGAVNQVNHYSTVTPRVVPGKEFKEVEATSEEKTTFAKKVIHAENIEGHKEKLQSKEVKLNPNDMPAMGAHALPHPIWDDYSIHNVTITHNKPKGIIDNMAYANVKLMRFSFDVISGYSWRVHTESIWLHRIIFLETVAGVPGMVAAMVRHLHSLRRMSRDHGWIHTLLEEAENERMHLMTAMQLKNPSPLFRWCVVGTQAIFVGWFSIAYLLSPRFCHRFVGYLEEQAVITYTNLLDDIDNGPMRHWATQPAPTVAISYWKLGPDAVMRDVVLAIRADEAHHRVVNHTLGSMKANEYNPYKPGE